jgi:hypothetical protein
MQFSSAAPRLPRGDKKWELLLLSPTATASAARLKNCFQQVRAYYGAAFVLLSAALFATAAPVAAKKGEEPSPGHMFDLRQFSAFALT